MINKKLAVIKTKLIRARMQWRKFRRKLFPSPAEIEFIRIFGGKYFTVSWIKDPRTGFPLTIITSIGKLLRRELIKHEVRVGRYYLDFAAITKYYRKAIECDGKQWHDIVKDQDRDEYLLNYGVAVMHIQAAKIWREPNLVQREVLNFLAK